MQENAKSVSFIYMQPEKVKFKYVQINMKQVSYVHVYTQKHTLSLRLCQLVVKRKRLRVVYCEFD